MCGIAGSSGAFSPDLLRRMAHAIRHRGPDDEGIEHLEEGRVGLAHRRLSIIDLSPAGHQPMWDEQRSVAIVYNGELYNFRELRKELENDGFRFRSNSDTEVLLQLYRRDGEEMLSRLNGIFAFAIWDARARSLFIARDPLGVKPLYHTRTASGFLFASELKALGIDDYFVLQDEGKMRWAVSLGVFSGEEAARNRLEALRAKGVRSAQTGERETQVAKIWFQIRGADTALQGKLKELAQGLPGTEIRACP